MYILYFKISCYLSYEFVTYDITLSPLLSFCLSVLSQSRDEKSHTLLNFCLPLLVWLFTFMNHKQSGFSHYNRYIFLPSEHWLCVQNLFLLINKSTFMIFHFGSMPLSVSFNTVPSLFFFSSFSSYPPSLWGMQFVCFRSVCSATFSNLELIKDRLSDLLAYLNFY